MSQVQRNNRYLRNLSYLLQALMMIMNDDDDDDDVFCVPGIMVVLIIVVNILATAFGAPA